MMDVREQFGVIRKAVADDVTKRPNREDAELVPIIFAAINIAEAFVLAVQSIAVTAQSTHQNTIGRITAALPDRD